MYYRRQYFSLTNKEYYSLDSHMHMYSEIEMILFPEIDSIILFNDIDDFELLGSIWYINNLKDLSGNNYRISDSYIKLESSNLHMNEFDRFNRKSALRNISFDYDGDYDVISHSLVKAGDYVNKVPKSFGSYAFPLQEPIESCNKNLSDLYNKLTEE